MNKLASSNQQLRSFRITAERNAVPKVIRLLEAEGFRFEPEPFSEWCYRLLEEPRPLGSSLAAFFGYVYIQDRSSMLPPLALAPRSGDTVLDMCASPGSKSGFLAQMVGREGFVLANELSHSRLFTLRANLRVCNFLQVSTCSYEGQRIPLRPGSLSAIQLDPPCSGWGTVEKNPRVLQLWHDEKVKPLIGLQRLLLAKAASLLRPGGTVVYSTCTTNSEENEQQVIFAEQELGLERVPLETFPGFVWDDREGSEGTLRVDGVRSGSQGFYIARLVKREDVPLPEEDEGLVVGKGSGRKKDYVRPEKKVAFVDPSSLASASFAPENLPAGKCAIFGGTLRFLPEAALSLLPDSFVWQGPALGRMGGGGFQADTRLRTLFPLDAPKIVLDSIADVRGLLVGQSFKSGLSSREAILWWQDLPLGRVSIKNGRIIAAFAR